MVFIFVLLGSSILILLLAVNGLLIYLSDLLRYDLASSDNPPSFFAVKICY